jgi:hypothetical protein
MGAKLRQKFQLKTRALKLEGFVKISLRIAKMDFSSLIYPHFFALA